MAEENAAFGAQLETPELKAILNRVKELENQGYEYEAAEGSLALLIGKALKHREPPFRVDAYHVSMRRDLADVRQSEEAMFSRFERNFTGVGVPKADGVEALNVAGSP